MAFDPTSRRYLPLKHVRELIARSNTFQAWVGVDPDDVAAARAFVHYQVVPDPAETPMPFAVVSLSGDSPSTELTGANTYLQRDSVIARFLAASTVTDPEDEQLHTFGDKVSVITEEIVADSQVYGFRLDGGPEVGDADLASSEETASRGSYAMCEVTFPYWD